MAKHRALGTTCVFKSQQRDFKVKIKVDNDMVLETKNIDSRILREMS